MPQPHKPQPPPRPPPVSPQQAERNLDSALDDSFPASDPVSSQQRVTASPPPRTTGEEGRGVLPAPTDEQQAQAQKNKRQALPDQGQRH